MSTSHQRQLAIANQATANYLNLLRQRDKEEQNINGDLIQQIKAANQEIAELKKKLMEAKERAIIINRGTAGGIQQTDQSNQRDTNTFGIQGPQEQTGRSKTAVTDQTFLQRHEDDIQELWTKLREKDHQITDIEYEKSRLERQVEKLTNNNVDLTNKYYKLETELEETKKTLSTCKNAQEQLEIVQKKLMLSEQENGLLKDQVEHQVEEKKSLADRLYVAQNEANYLGELQHVISDLNLKGRDKELKID